MRENELRDAINKIRLSESTFGRLIGKLRQTEVVKMDINVSTKRKNSISPYIFMQFAEPLGTADSSVDAGWDYLGERWQPKLLGKVKELEPTMIRFGGCFASYYRWREAVGPRGGRVPMLNLCWDGVYSNQVGTDEIVGLCRETGAEPLLVVNMESDGRERWAHPKPGEDRLGTAREAAEWVAYCNDPDDKLRLSHGVREPYRVRYWQIGNETSYDSKGFGVEETAKKTVEFAREMRAVDPSIKLIAWGDAGSAGNPSGKIDWAPRICEAVGDEVEYIAFHHHFGSGLPDSPLYGVEYRLDPENTWRHLMNAYKSLQTNIERMRSEVAPYGKRLAMTEGHFMLPGRNRCEVLSSWGAGAAYARCLNTIERATDILDIATLADFFGNRWQCNALMLPTPIRGDEAYLQPVGEVMKLYRHHIGSHAVDVSETSGADLTASISEDGGKLFLHAVNTDRSTPKSFDIKIDGAAARSVTAFEISADPSAEITSLTPNIFAPVERKVEGSTYILPPAGVAALEITL